MRKKTPISPAKKKSPKQEKNKSAGPPSIAKATNRLLVDIRSLHLVLGEITDSLGTKIGKDAKAFTEFINKHASVSKGRRSKQLAIPVQELAELKRLLDGLAVSSNSLPLSTRGLFLVLVSKWDAYVGSVLRWVYGIRPDIINSSGRSILYTELRDIGDMQAARDKIVEDEISTV
jgi:hypothetical protein